MNDSITKSRGTFLLDIYNTQHATWQGRVTWVDKQTVQYFRSALELIKLIESALEEKEESKEGEGNHEK